MIKFFLIILLFFETSVAQSVQLNKSHIMQGYAIQQDSARFIFDAQIYNKSPKKVVVTGSFRGWDQNMDDLHWQLKKINGTSLWSLTVPNKGFAAIPIKSEFKFIIDSGDWLSPPTSAPNIKNGNLVFAHNKVLLRVKAEALASGHIRYIFIEGNPKNYTYTPNNYILNTFGGDSIKIEKVLYIRPGELQLIPEKKINIRRFHTLSIANLNKTIPVKYDGWFRDLFSSKEFGANWDSKSGYTQFALFAPRADLIKLYLYKNPGDPPSKTIKMKRDDDGVWEYALKGNFTGWYYDFTAHGPNEPGNHFYETNPIHFSDPWARVSVDTWGPARIWPKMQPATPLKNGTPKLQDVVAYEVHVQDFTRLLPLPDSLKGSFKGFVYSGLTNKQGAPIGFDHLVNLGINTVHLMPVQEYLHYSDKEWQKAFKNDPYMIDQGINLENYQWGYRTSHAFAIESRYRVKGAEWGSQNKDFRDLVQAFHDKGIAVIVDLVFNHTAEKMDRRMMYFNFAAIDVPYFYRTDDNLDFIGAYGTETKSEERPIMQRWIIEQCTDLITQYGIDGFRIDLAGQTDEQTLLNLREALGPDIIIYGEPWIASNDPDYENNPDWDWYKEDAPITFFQDESRNAFKGPTSNPKDKNSDRGYAGGNGERENVKNALSAGFRDDKTPLSGINYLDIHDNWALADRFALKNWDGRQGVDEDAYKIATTLLFTSLGPIVLHGGSEFMRSKASAPLVELVKETESGPIWIHGKRDTYNLARANQFEWGNLGSNMDDGDEIKCNYQNMNNFWKGFIAFRKSLYGQVFRISEKPDSNYYKWLEPENKKLLGYFVDESVLVLLNTDSTHHTFADVNFPPGIWRLIGNNEQVNPLKTIPGKKDSVLKGNRRYSLHVQGNGLKIWVRDFVN
jgi:pullulanase